MVPTQSRNQRQDRWQSSRRGLRRPQAAVAFRRTNAELSDRTGGNPAEPLQPKVARPRLLTQSMSTVEDRPSTSPVWDLVPRAAVERPPRHAGAAILRALSGDMFLNHSTRYLGAGQLAACHLNAATPAGQFVTIDAEHAMLVHRNSAGVIAILVRTGARTGRSRDRPYFDGA